MSYTTVGAVSRRDVLLWNGKSGRLEVSRGNGKRTGSVDRMKAATDDE